MADVYFKSNYAPDLHFCGLLCKRFAVCIPNFITSVKKIDAVNHALNTCRKYTTLHPLAALLQMSEPPDQLLTRPASFFTTDIYALPALPDSTLGLVVGRTLDTLDRQWVNSLLDLTKALIGFPVSLAINARDKVDATIGHAARYYLIEALNNESETWQQYITALTAYHLEISTARNSQLHNFTVPMTTSTSHLEGEDTDTNEVITDFLKTVRDGFLKANFATSAATTSEDSPSGFGFNLATAEKTIALVRATKSFIAEHYYDIVGHELEQLLPEVRADSENEDLNSEGILMAPYVMVFVKTFLELVAGAIANITPALGKQPIEGAALGRILFEISKETDPGDSSYNRGDEANTDTEVTNSTFTSAVLPAWLKMQEMLLDSEVMSKIINKQTQSSVRTGLRINNEEELEAEIMQSAPMQYYLRSNPLMNDPRIRHGVLNLLPVLKNGSLMRQLELLQSNPIYKLHFGGLVSPTAGKEAILLQTANGKGLDPVATQAIVQAMDTILLADGPSNSVVATDIPTTEVPTPKEELMARVFSGESADGMANIIKFPPGAFAENSINHFLSGGLMTDFGEPSNIFSKVYRLSNHVASIERPNDLARGVAETVDVLREREEDAKVYPLALKMHEQGAAQFVASFQSHRDYPELVRSILRDISRRSALPITNSLRQVAVENDDDDEDLQLPPQPRVTDVLSDETLEMMANMRHAVSHMPGAEDFKQLIALATQEEREASEWCYTKPRIDLERQFGHGLWIDESSPLDMGIFNAMKKAIENAFESRSEERAKNNHTSIKKLEIPIPRSPSHPSLENRDFVDDNKGQPELAAAAAHPHHQAQPTASEFSSTASKTPVSVRFMNKHLDSSVDDLRRAIVPRVRQLLHEFGKLRSTLNEKDSIDPIDLFDSSSEWQVTMPLGTKESIELTEVLEDYVVGLCSKSGSVTIQPDNLDGKEVGSSLWLTKLVKACGNRRLPIIFKGFNREQTDSRNLYWWLLAEVIGFAIRYQMLLEFDLRAIINLMSQNDTRKGDEELEVLETRAEFEEFVKYHTTPQNYNDAVVRYLELIEIRAKDGTLSDSEMEILRLNYLQNTMSHYADQFRHIWSKVSISRLGHTIVTKEGQRKITGYLHLMFTMAISYVGMPYLTNLVDKTFGKWTDFAKKFIPESFTKSLFGEGFEILAKDKPTEGHVKTDVEDKIAKATTTNDSHLPKSSKAPPGVTLRMEDWLKRMSAGAPNEPGDSRISILFAPGTNIDVAVSNSPSKAGYADVSVALNKVNRLVSIIEKEGATIPALGSPAVRAVAAAASATPNEPTNPPPLVVEADSLLESLHKNVSINQKDETKYPSAIADALNKFHDGLLDLFIKAKTAAEIDEYDAQMDKGLGIMKEKSTLHEFNSLTTLEKKRDFIVETSKEYFRNKADILRMETPTPTSDLDRIVDAGILANQSTELLRQDRRESNVSSSQAFKEWALKYGVAFIQHLPEVLAAVKRGSSEWIDGVLGFIENHPIKSTVEGVYLIIMNFYPFMKYIHAPYTSVSTKIDMKDVSVERPFSPEVLDQLGYNDVNLHLDWKMKGWVSLERTDYDREVGDIQEPELREHAINGGLRFELERYMMAASSPSSTTQLMALGNAALHAGWMSLASILSMLIWHIVLPTAEIAQIGRANCWIVSGLCSLLIVLSLFIRAKGSGLMSTAADAVYGASKGVTSFVKRRSQKGVDPKSTAFIDQTQPQMLKFIEAHGADVLGLN